MVDEIQHKINVLEEKIKQLTSENVRMAERSEEIYLLAMATESINNISDHDLIIRSMFEKISMLKDIPFCAYGIKDKRKLVFPISHVSYADSSGIKELYLNDTIEYYIEQGVYFTDKRSKENNVLFDTISDSSFTPASILLIPHKSVSSDILVFVFADDKKTSRKLHDMMVMLQEAIQILTSKLDNNYLLDELKRINFNLEKMVSERTSQLWHSNNLLRKEIAEKKRTEEKLQQMNEELNNFVYRVSHDLRAPITSVEGLITIIRLEQKSNSVKVNEYIDLLEERVQSLDRFIRDLLSHSRITNTEIQLEEIQFETIINDCFDELYYLDNHEKIEKKVRITGSNFINDRVSIYEIFRNLISNAIKYSDPDKEKNRIQVKVKIDQDKALISVQDTGIGISKDVLPKVFDMFFRGHEHSKGSGIGLYIVREAVDKMKGKIEVSSVPHQGTNFSITVPNMKKTKKKGSI